MNGEIKMGAVNRAIEDFKRIDIDGETMQYIIEKLGMEDQMLNLKLRNLKLKKDEVVLKK